MIRFAIVLLFALPLAACNSVRPTAPPQASAGAVPPVAASEGSGCAAAVARYRAVAKADADSGNVNGTVFKQIEGEIAKAEAACAAGRDAEARSLVSASKARHGYPGG